MHSLSYLLGSVTTILFCAFLLFIVLKLKKKSDSIVAPRISQSLAFNMMKPFIVTEQEIEIKQTQSLEFEKKNTIRVILVDHKAYWIFNNTLYVADEIDGQIDKNSMRPVDTMTMDDVQLDKTIFIVNSLTEGVDDDNWNSGNKKF